MKYYQIHSLFFTKTWTIYPHFGFQPESLSSRLIALWFRANCLISAGCQAHNASEPPPPKSNPSTIILRANCFKMEGIWRRHFHYARSASVILLRIQRYPLTREGTRSACTYRLSHDVPCGFVPPSVVIVRCALYVWPIWRGWCIFSTVV